MIVSWRMPMLTAWMMAATRKAMEDQRPHAASVSEVDASAAHLVRQLEDLGYGVVLERLAA